MFRVVPGRAVLAAWILAGIAGGWLSRRLP